MSARLFRNFYKCPQCDACWEDDWTAIVDDTCSDCGCRNISPYETQDIDEAGFVIVKSAKKQTEETKMNYIILEIVDTTPQSPVHQRETRQSALSLAYQLVLENTDDQPVADRAEALASLTETGNWFAPYGDYSIHLLELIPVPPLTPKA